MPAYYSSNIGKFLSVDAEEILSELVRGNSANNLDVVPLQTFSWDTQLPLLTSAFRELLRNYPRASEWPLFLEFSIPLVRKRIDCIILAGNCVAVIELKTGDSIVSAQCQVEEYALNLACFHQMSHGRKILPIVASEVAKSETRASEKKYPWIEAVRSTRLSCFSRLLIEIAKGLKEDEATIDAVEWEKAPYVVIPPIVDAMVALYRGIDIFDVTHSYASKDELEQTTDAIRAAVETARAGRSSHVICFVTGVPGAGKTLVGLNLVHLSGIRELGLFVSGNGPLIKVLQESLTRDILRQETLKDTKSNRVLVGTKVSAFIRDVHDFTESYSSTSGAVARQNVVVFDEAQRAWTAEQVVAWSKKRRKSRDPISEPEAFLDIMEKLPWAVVVALVGNGQEINKGEAGIEEWGRALKHRPKWYVKAPQEALSGSNSKFAVFDDVKAIASRIQEVKRLHLSVNRRSVKAEHLNEWVECVLDGDCRQANSVASRMDLRPTVTRNLNHARRWLRERRVGFTKAGLVSSAKSARLRADGIETSYDFLNRYHWTEWFLNRDECIEPNCSHLYCRDVNSSGSLEVAATQFKIQGLELDWIGLLWGEDFTWEGSYWATRTFDGSTWKEKSDAGTATQKETRKFIRNGYRVLLTRARQGMILYIPNPEEHYSRLPKSLDRTAQFLVDAGALPIDSST